MKSKSVLFSPWLLQSPGQASLDMGAVRINAGGNTSGTSAAVENNYKHHDYRQIQEKAQDGQASTCKMQEEAKTNTINIREV